MDEELTTCAECGASVASANMGRHGQFHESQRPKPKPATVVTSDGVERYLRDMSPVPGQVLEPPFFDPHFVGVRWSLEQDARGVPKVDEDGQATVIRLER